MGNVFASCCGPSSADAPQRCAKGGQAQTRGGGGVGAGAGGSARARARSPRLTHHPSLFPTTNKQN